MSGTSSSPEAGAASACSPAGFGAIGPSRAALVVIDLQRDFLSPEGYAATAGLDVARLRGVIAPALALIDAARAAGMFVVYTREGHRPDLSDCPAWKLERSRRGGAEIGGAGPLGRLLVRGEYGHDLIDELDPRADEPVIDKPGYSAFHATDLDALLRVRGIDTLIVCGVTTEVCVHTTLRAASDLGYRCLTAADATAASEAQLQMPALAMIGVEGGVFGEVASSADIVAALAAASIPLPEPT
ncbi:cysteine hydrolase family protein [Derxia gummosa]|uniref:Cysteine hydrolase family protein n=1 Tax=Derxia gummosa DSM 723 TaxID=1121388 RepID=A0A8B6X7U7_9BURK|nr:isochorismatase family cysteine hydrolase [Derxia gummosa]